MTGAATAGRSGSTERRRFRESPARSTETISTAQFSRRYGSRTTGNASGREHSPVTLGDDFDGTVGHFDGGLVVHRVGGHRHTGGPPFCVGHRVLRQVGVVQVRKYRKV